MTISRVTRRSRGLSDDLASRGASRHARRRPTMRDALSRRSGDGAPEPPPTPPGLSPTITPADPAAPDSPNAPGGDPSGPSRPTPAPQRPQRPLASHPGDALGRLRNNPPDEEDPPEQTITTTFTPHVFKTTPEQHSRCVVLPDISVLGRSTALLRRLNAPTGAWCSLTPALGSGGMTPLRGPGAPPAPGAPLRTGQHRVQSST